MGHESLATVSARVDSLIFSESDEQKAKAKLMELMDAKVVVRGTERTPSGSPIYVERPDNGVQLAAAVKVIEWRRGKPAQTMNIDHTDPASGQQDRQDLLKVMKNNPDLTQKILESIIGAAKHVQAIPVEAVNSETAARPPE